MHSSDTPLLISYFCRVSSGIQLDGEVGNQRTGEEKHENLSIYPEAFKFTYLALVLCSLVGYLVAQLL